MKNVRKLEANKAAHVKKSKHNSPFRNVGLSNNQHIDRSKTDTDTCAHAHPH